MYTSSPAYHITDVCVPIVVYQGVCRRTGVCVGYVFSVVGNLILLSQPRCAAWCYETWPPPTPPSPTIAAPSPPLSSKPAQNSALRHMWKQFSQCPEQGSPHTHKQTYTHTSLIYTRTHTHTHTHFTLTPSHILCADIHTPSIRSHVTLICPLLRCSLHGIWQCVNSTVILNCYQVVYTQSVSHVYARDSSGFMDEVNRVLHFQNNMCRRESVDFWGCCNIVMLASNALLTCDASHILVMSAV